MDPHTANQIWPYQGEERPVYMIFTSFLKRWLENTDTIPPSTEMLHSFLLGVRTVFSSNS